jgi:hypothetical protein
MVIDDDNDNSDDDNGDIYFGWLTLSCSSKKVLQFFSQTFIRKEWFCILSSKHLKPPALPQWGVRFLLGCFIHKEQSYEQTLLHEIIETIAYGAYTAGGNTAYILTDHMLRCPSREFEDRTQARTATISTCHN